MQDFNGVHCARLVCRQCDRPSEQCICQWVPSVPNRTLVTVLQHPRERRHPIGTARLLRLGLTETRQEVCWELTASRQLQSSIRRRSAVLFPHPAAQPIDSLDPLDPLEELIVLDGTWPQARALHRANGWLHGLPHFSVKPDGIDRYRIRREPRAQFTSTVEAVVHALKAVEPQTPNLDALLDAFSVMISQQVAQRQRVRRRRFARPRGRVYAIPSQWQQHAPAVVAVYCEFTLARTPDRRVRELVYVTAHHPHTGRTWSTAVRPPTLTPTREHLAFMEVSDAVIDGALEPMQVRAAWDAFKPPEAQIVVWNKISADLCEIFAPEDKAPQVMKAVYCNVTRRHPCGHLEEVIRHHGLSHDAVGGEGRPAFRLAHAVRLWRWLTFEQSRVRPLPPSQTDLA